MPSVRPIPLTDLEVSPYNVRLREPAEGIDDLARSLDQYKLKQPIVVYRRGGKYQILIGQRRFLAAKKLRWKEIDAIVQPAPDELDARAISLSENVQRVDLDPRDKADTCKYLFDRLGSVRNVAKRLGVSETTVRRWLDYAAVPQEMKDLVAAGKISRPLATRIALALEDDPRAVKLANEVAKLKPAKGLRDRIVMAVQEIPDRSVESILERAEELKMQKRISFILPESWSKRMDRAAREFEQEPGEIAREATIEWLRVNA